MIPSAPIIVQKVTKPTLRAIWNEPAFQNSLLRRATQRVDVCENPPPASAGQDERTLSYAYHLMDNSERQLLGTFHICKKRDGSIGVSGMHDPIFLLVDGVALCDP